MASTRSQEENPSILHVKRLVVFVVGTKTELALLDPNLLVLITYTN